MHYNKMKILLKSLSGKINSLVIRGGSKKNFTFNKYTEKWAYKLKPIWFPPV